MRLPSHKMMNLPSNMGDGMQAKEDRNYKRYAWN
jgi:hypothetical protein